MTAVPRFAVRSWSRVGICCVLSLLGASDANSANTFVEFDTSLGRFQVELFDSVTPITVSNFLQYVDAGRYVDSFVHRDVPGFVIQGGGYTYASDQIGVARVPAFAPITNEPVLSNVRGTLAIAKLGGDPNSATSQWFINLSNNSANLDIQNGGFTVFGQVVGSGMQVVDAIAATPIYNAGGAFAQLPLQNYAGGPVQKSHLIIVDIARVVPEPTGATLAACAAGCCALRFRRHPARRAPQ